MSLVTDLWRNQPGEYFCISTKSLTGEWKDHFIARGDWTAARELINNNRDKDLYMCPHGFDRRKRLKVHSIDPKLLYADLDECDPRSIGLRPTIAIESSPGRYVGYWVTNRRASEELNRRMAYMIGADISGWDRTQVLRIPGTRNFKYPSKPRVRLLWDDGPTYTIKELEALVPEVHIGGKGQTQEGASKIYKEYEKRLPIWVRKELMAKEVTVGKRSEVLWKLHHALLEVGMTRDEAFQVLWVSPWNKFADRRNGEEQLLKELDKALNQHFTSYTSPNDRVEDSGKWNPLPVPVSKIEEENIDWLIPGMLAKKELTIVEGDPGQGKSYLVQMIAGTICDGRTVPCIKEYEPIKGKVAYFDTENTVSTVTKPRLVENRVENLHNYFQGEQPFSIDDVDKWEAVIERLEALKPKLVVFDTINTYIGSTDSYRSSEVQQAMGFFKEIAVRFDCSVVLLRHLTKGSKDKALYRGQGSIAFSGAARIVATVGTFPDEPSVRVVACTKNNISKAFDSFTFTIMSLPDRGGRTNRSRLVWGETVDLTSEDLMIVPDKPGKRSAVRDEALKWLTELLTENGRMDSSKIYRMGEARNFSKSTLVKAADALQVMKELTGFGKAKVSWWSLPLESGDSSEE